MLSDNIKNFRKAKGLSQDELAAKLNVVRQTISKWEKGLSVPDSEMLIRISEVLEAPVSVLLAETIESDVNSELKVIANKLEVINEQILKYNESRRKTLRAIFVVISIFASCILLSSIISSIYLLFAINEAGADAAIIGGADGPTAIFVSATRFKPLPLVASIIATVISVIGICKTRKN